MIKRRSLLYPLIAVALAVVLITLSPSHPTLAQSTTPSSPPLGNLLQEYKPVVMPEATAYSLFTTDPYRTHQVWYRVVGGNALFRQRLRVYQENAGPRPRNQVPPEVALRQELISNNPSNWLVLPSTSGIFTYYFDADHESITTGLWQSGRGIKVKQSVFDHGSLYELGFEDQISLDDYNDLVIQVAIILQ